MFNKVRVFPGEFEEEGDLGQGNEGVCKEMIGKESKTFYQVF